jgi:hypothetical protein
MPAAQGEIGMISPRVTINLKMLSAKKAEDEESDNDEEYASSQQTQHFERFNTPESAYLCAIGFLNQIAVFRPLFALFIYRRCDFGVEWIRRAPTQAIHSIISPLQHI